MQRCRSEAPYKFSKNSVIPSTPDFQTEYQICRNSDSAGLPVFIAIWGPGFRASIITLAHMLKQVKQIRITLMTMLKVNPSPPNEVDRSTLICTQRRGTRVIVVFCMWILQCIGLCASNVRLLTSKLDNCNEVGSQLPHSARISTASCLNNQGERNDVLEVSVRVQNV